MYVSEIIRDSDSWDQLGLNNFIPHEPSSSELELDLGELASRHALNFPIKYQHSARATYMCNKRWFNLSCPGCNFLRSIKFRCNNRFCTEPACIDKRIAERKASLFVYKYKNELDQEVYNFPYPKRCHHWTIGSNRMTQPELFKVLYKLIKQLTPKFGHYFNGKKVYPFIAAFDIGLKNHKETGKLFYHIHVMAYNKNKQDGWVDYKQFIELAREKLQKIAPGAVLSNAMRVNKKAPLSGAVLDYLCKRASGVLGHKSKDYPDYYYYKDIMSEQAYYEEFFSKHFLVHRTPKGYLTSISGKVSTERECPECGDHLIFHCYSLDPLGEEYKEEVLKPP